MSNTQKKNVPELRFPGFEGEWEEKKLGDLIKVNSGKDYKHLDKGDIPVYGTGGYMTSVSEPLSEIDAVGIGRKGTINKPYLLEAPFWTVDTLFYCTPKKEADILFILSLFRKINWKLYDESTGVPSLSKQTINKINRLVPTNKEQQKIGEFFSKLDRQIELEEQKLELLQQQKKGYMQKIFSQELRFKDENGNDYPNWRTIELKNILENIVDNRGKTPDNAPSEKYPLLEVNALGYYRPAYIKVSKFVSENTYNNWFREHLKENDILFSTVGNTGIVSLMDNYKAVIAQNIVGLRVNNNNLPSFIYYMLSYKGNQKKIKRIQMGAVQPSVKVSQFKFIKYLVPIKDEQEKVAKLLIEIDKLVNKQLIKIELLQQRKKALLKSMFI
ncbi:TPA: restriction endonuclease subunit S [Staphylococcus aureus]|nr:restriction endonuclease subunit S [Staphylococcus aureus]HDE8067239.1 restriction endonuclease subunit S [Staphylococcus aureus]HDE8581578.1 restriction endonuclease subunit S [Staphylococcus aureus]HDE9031395.1 restriction endonuclease subunit S [Staphylococcus aureus]HDK3285259.1 restriction endonuclease subunit S [Staphylococcus aureus]